MGMNEVTREWAVVLGASGGTGGAVAASLAREPGLSIFGVHRGRRPDAAAAVEAEVRGAGVACHMHVGGAGTLPEVQAGCREILRVAGPRSVKVLAHAIADASYGMFLGNGSWKKLDAARIQRTFESMAHSFVYWVQELVALDLLAPEARLIAMTNPMVDSVVHGWGLVAAAKAALETYVRQMAHELGPSGHRVMLLKFGMVETHAIRVAFPPAEWERVKREISQVTPARRLCTVEEVGRFVSVLAGHGGDWFAGSTIDLTGNQTGSLLDTIFNRPQAE
jgi:NAD(P)-dependent dehydrogenase (short-subunit alcohol dehydrogenase family)